MSSFTTPINAWQLHLQHTPISHTIMITCLILCTVAPCFYSLRPQQPSRQIRPDRTAFTALSLITDFPDLVRWLLIGTEHCWHRCSFTDTLSQSQRSPLASTVVLLQTWKHQLSHVAEHIPPPSVGQWLFCDCWLIWSAHLWTTTTTPTHGHGRRRGAHLTVDVCFVLQ